MGTERDEFPRPCPCGQGIAKFVQCSPDHAWPSAYSVYWTCTIECEQCAKDFMFDTGGCRIIRRSDHEAVQRRRTAFEAAQQKLMASRAVAKLKADLLARLATHNSIASRYRYLGALASGSIGTFTKNWRGDSDWVNRHVAVYNLAKIAQLLGQDATPFIAEADKLEQLKMAIGCAATVMTPRG